MILALLFFGGCAVFAFWMSTQRRGLIIDGFTLGPDGARIFMLVLAALSLGFVLLGAFALLRQIPKELVLDEESISVPTATWRKAPNKVVRFADVIAVKEQSISGQVMTTLETRDTKAVIAKSHLPEGAYLEIMSIVRSRRRPH